MSGKVTEQNRNQNNQGGKASDPLRQIQAESGKRNIKPWREK
jgi:hypothetical protein